MNKYAPRLALSEYQWFSNQISITSSTGVGKSVCLEALKSVFSRTRQLYECVSLGELMFGRGKQFGFKTKTAFAEYLRANPGLGHDKWLDDQTVECGKHNWMVVEGRLPHVFMPRAFHVLLVCDLDLCARRRAGTNRGSEFLRVRQEIEKRDSDDRNRFARLYPGCLWDKRSFNLTLDTEHFTPEEEAKRIIGAHWTWVNKIPKNNLLTDDEIIEG